MKFIATAITTLVLVGCATIGNRINWDAAKTFTVGITTEQEAVAKLGPPHSTARTRAGTTITWAWFHAGPTMQVQSETLTLTFGLDGKLIGMREQK